MPQHMLECAAETIRRHGTLALKLLLVPTFESLPCPAEYEVEVLLTVRLSPTQSLKRGGSREEK